MNDDAQCEQPWVCSGGTEEHEDQLIGNREGFRVLKQKIDEVLEAGHARVQAEGVEWVGLKLVADDPRKQRMKKRGRDVISLLVVAGVVAALLFVFVVGVGTVYSWWK